LAAAVSRATIIRTLKAMAAAGSPAKCVICRPDGSLAFLTDTDVLAALDLAADAPAPTTGAAEKKATGRGYQKGVLEKALALAQTPRGPRAPKT